MTCLFVIFRCCCLPSPQFSSTVKGVFEAVISRLHSRDQDQNVKLACISTAGIIIQHHGAANQDLVARLLPIIIERLASDTMRVSVLKSLTQSFAAGPSCIRYSTLRALSDIGLNSV
jgi:hypothetical protein